MGRNKKNNRQKRLKKQNEKLLTALTSTAASTSSAATAATTAATVGAANDTDDGTTETTTTITCYHGSDEENFAKTSDYQILFDACMLMVDFETKYEHLLKDSDVYKYIFAYITNMFRNSYRTEKYSPFFKRKLQQILHLGIESKYCHSPLSADTEKRDKYVRDISTDRGIINILHRETSPFCKCMEPMKLESQKMEKMGICFGCDQEFPKMQLKRCNRCDHAQYYGKECQKNSWPRHKEYCHTNTTINNNSKTPITSEE